MRRLYLNPYVSKLQSVFTVGIFPAVMEKGSLSHSSEAS